MRVYRFAYMLHVFAYTRGGLHVPPVHMHTAIRAHSVRFIGARFSRTVFLSLSFFLTPILLPCDSPRLPSIISIFRSLFHSPPLSFSHCFSVYVKTHTRPDSMRWFPILVIPTRQNGSTPCRCNGVIQGRAFTPARA